jgi:hypothetical protein
MKHRAIASLLLLALAMSAPALRAAPPAIPSLAVQGVLQSGEFLGAPGNGDNPASDHSESVYYLQLPAPLNKQVHPAGDLASFSAAAQNSAFVQLIVFDEEQSVARSLLGKRVRIVGTLLEPDGGTRHTPALVQVKSLTAIRDWQW